MIVKCKFNLLCLLWHAGLTHSHYSSINNISRKVAFLLDEVVRQLFQLALIPNAKNMQILTTHVQPPKAITTGNMSGVEFIDTKGFRKCPGYSCLLGSKHENHKFDLRYYLSEVSKSILCKKNLLHQYHHGPRQLKLSEQRCNSALLARCVLCG